MTPSSNAHPSETRLLLVVLGLCFLLRLAVVAHFHHELSEDRDNYLILAQNIAAGHGYTQPSGEEPTAYRPPLYPLLVAPISGPDQAWQRGGLHLVLATGTCGLIWLIARQLGLGPWQGILASALYAVDPLSLRYVSLPMTETTCTFLAALLLFLLTREGRRPLVHAVLTGITFGACGLCRPTFWAFGMLYSVAWLVTRRFVSTRGGVGAFHVGLAGFMGMSAVVLPWVLRNWWVLGVPLLTTTHGGYTLLLGNNEVFYREVVDQPLGTIWDGSNGIGQVGWWEQVKDQLDRENITGELAQDRWMSERAWVVIGEHPATFLRAAVKKFLWLWNVVPHAPAAEGVPGVLLGLIAVFYVILWTFLAAGIGGICVKALHRQKDWFLWNAPLLLVLSFTGAHLFYWSDARMRAPLMPAVCVIAVSVFSLRSKRSAISADEALKSTK